MKKYLPPLALISAAAVVFVACTEVPTATTGLNLNASNTIGIVSAGEVQVCLDGTSPGTNTYSVALSNFTGILSGDVQGTTPQSLTPGNCITALTKGTSGYSGGLYPSGFVTATASTNAAGGTWTFTCTADGAVAAHCPVNSGSGNVAVGGASNPHGSQIIFHYEPEPVIQDNVALFVIGDAEAHGIGTTINYWGSQWWKNNSMSGFVANGVASFKGYATGSDNVCGGTWRSNPGNSSVPPATVPSSMRIIVTSTVNKAGPNISGNIVQILNITTNPGYGVGPGKQGWGVVTSVECPPQA